MRFFSLSYREYTLYSGIPFRGYVNALEIEVVFNLSATKRL
jgi:hypothetical protein